jgi:glyoxylase-like metal-dependent hydrolase (beta-lactamase superfamily II)
VADPSGRVVRGVFVWAVALVAVFVLAARPGRLVAAAQSRPAVPAGEPTRLADDLFVISIPGEANVVAYTGPDGVVLVDGVSADRCDALMKAVAGLSAGRPVTTLFNTHWHPEQTGCNERLAKAGASIIAHENTRLWLTTDVVWPWNGRRFARAPTIAQPAKTFYTTGQLASGIRYGYLPDAAHTDGDLYVHFPQQNVLAVGEVVSGQGWPVVDWTSGGWIGGILGAHQRVLALGNQETRFVPSHGPVLSFAEVKTHGQMYATIYERLTQLLNKGRGPSEAVEAKPTKEFDAQMGDPDEFVRRAFESLWAYLSPDA